MEQEITGEFELTREMQFDWNFCKRFQSGITFEYWLEGIVKQKLPNGFKLMGVFYEKRNVYYYGPVVFYKALRLTEDEKITECLEHFINNLQLMPSPFSNFKIT